LNRSAARINNYAAWICIQAGGGYIRDPELAWNEIMMFCEDGVHLSDIGNELFLFRMQAYLFDFMNAFDFQRPNFMISSLLMF
jgi:hypothetical protein